ncbi:MAG: aminoacyl-tRNA hydrolase [Candidatus Gastranaerophilales bacterium]|nr:aminoacyl-tRNA hydrolase [Candidatus Gastranaerophilales bacterium]
MKALIGLGNPEVKYKITRHNTGFLIMDEILRAHNVSLGDKFNSFFGKKGDLLYLLPKTYMNLSGRAVIELMNFYKLKNTDILVIYDDATIQFGTFRFKKEGSFGGHNGIKSIIQSIGTDKFDRLKVGVGPVPDNIPIDSFVLGNFSETELNNVSKMAKIALNAVDCWINEGIETAQNKYNKVVI